MTVGRYTELFFLDEATALAAGHRPCWECQRQKHMRFKGLFEQVQGRALKAPEMDRLLHAERQIPYRRSQWKQTFSAEFGTLPDYTMIAIAGEPYLKREQVVLRWTPFGYENGADLSAETEVTVLTPRSTVAVLRLGYVSTLDASAG